VVVLAVMSLLLAWSNDVSTTLSNELVGDFLDSDVCGEGPLLRPDRKLLPVLGLLG